jgi:hypothetical protein
MDSQPRKIAMTFGLLALVAMHALMIRVPLPAFDQSRQSSSSFCFDTIEGSIAAPSLKVNAEARDEIKKQGAPQVGLPKPGTRVVKHYNLDLFVTSDARSQRLLNWFQSDPSLSKIAAKCNYQVYAPNDDLYLQRYSQWVPPTAFPAIMMTRPDGGHCYVASKSEIPDDPAALRTAMQSHFEASDKAAQLAKQSEIESSGSKPCPDGKCPPKIDRDRPFFPRDDSGGGSIFPDRQPDGLQLIEGLFRSSGIGLESVALLILCVVVVVLLFRR